MLSQFPPSCYTSPMNFWEEQWALHAPHFKEGFVHLEGGLRLKPGPGFGDLSHPTTRVVLELMAPYVKGKKVIDIGCGSGVLALSALKAGAKSAVGFDIEEEAVLHATENAKLNGLNAHFFLSSQVAPHLHFGEVALMNMIYTEQRAAFNAHPALNQNKWIITSGVLSSQREEYFEITSGWNWKLVEEKEKEGWLGFVFANPATP